MKHILLPDGRDLAWRESGSGPPLFLLHGWGSSSAIFAELMTHLPACRSHAVDLPGYGASSPAATVDLTPLADDFIDWLDALNLKEVNLLGWSLGGMLAQEIASRFPQRIARLILAATTPSFVATPDWSHGLAATAVRALARDFRRAPVLTLDSFWRLQYQGEGSVPVPLLPEVELATALGGLELLRQADLRPRLSRITMPTLVVHGSDDVIIPVAAGRYLATTLPQAKLLEVSGVGHAPFRSAVLSVSATIRQFLS